MLHLLLFQALDQLRAQRSVTSMGKLYLLPFLLLFQALDLSEASSEEEEDVVEDYLGGGGQDVGSAYKMVFVVNAELCMGLGKTASQVAHAAIGLYRLLIDEQQRFGEMLLYWEQFG